MKQKENYWDTYFKLYEKEKETIEPSFIERFAVGTLKNLGFGESPNPKTFNDGSGNNGGRGGGADDYWSRRSDGDDDNEQKFPSVLNIITALIGLNLCRDIFNGIMEARGRKIKKDRFKVKQITQLQKYLIGCACSFYYSFSVLFFGVGACYATVLYKKGTSLIPMLTCVGLGTLYGFAADGVNLRASEVQEELRALLHQSHGLLK